MKTRFALSLSAALTLMSCQHSAVTPGAEPPSGAGTPNGAPEVEIIPQEDQAVTRLDHHSAVIKATWKNADPADTQTLELFAPDGTLFQRFTGPVGEGGTAAARLLIRGTYVDEYHMVGTWTAKVYRNAATVPAQTTTFEILPAQVTR